MIGLALYLYNKVMNKRLALFEKLAWQLSIPPLLSPLFQRAFSTVMLCLVHCTSLMLHFRYLQKDQ